MLYTKMLRLKTLISLLTVAAVCFIVSCQSDGPSKTKRLLVPDNGMEFRVEQRTSHVLPGNSGDLLLTLDDITKGKVHMTIADTAGDPLLAQYVKEGDLLNFNYFEAAYQLKVDTLKNFLIGKDFASLTLIPGQGAKANNE